MSSSTLCPPIVWLRQTIEKHILDLYESDGVTLKSDTEWPGYYTLPTGAKTPAVFVTATESVPSSWRIAGIECVIEGVPDIKALTLQSGIVSLETWNVRFTNYGTNDGTIMPVSLLDIRRRLARAFPRDQVTYMTRTEVTYESLTARISGAVLNPPIP